MSKFTLQDHSGVQRNNNIKIEALGRRCGREPLSVLAGRVSDTSQSFELVVRVGSMSAASPVPLALFLICQIGILAPAAVTAKAISSSKFLLVRVQRRCFY